MTYKHQNNGSVAELIETKPNTVKIKIISTGEIKEIGLATFRRWWKPVNAPAEPQNEPDQSETNDADNHEPTEPTATEDDTEPLKLSIVIDRLERLFDWLNELCFDSALVKPLILIQSPPRTFKRDELSIRPEYLSRPIGDVAAAILHEMVHLYCYDNDISETSQNGRYYNKRYKSEAETRGLQVAYNYAVGYGITSPTESLLEGLRNRERDLDEPFARYAPTPTRIRTANANLVRNKARAYICPVCGQTVRSAQELVIICGICEKLMERAD